MEELITVIINVYNGEKFINRCLDSVVNQTYKNIEILIINDGSTDNTLDICKSYKDDRIRIITTENLGLSMSRNIGIDNAKGEYLYFVDVDDWVKLDTIEHLYDLCKKYNVKMSTCKTIDVFDYNVVVKETIEKVDKISNIEMLKKVLLSKERAGNFWNKLMKKELFQNIRFENRPINDVVVVYKLILDIDFIAYSNQIKYFYLQRKSSITGIRYESRSIDLYKAVVERYDYIKKIYPDLIENEICLLSKIMMLYIEEKPGLHKYLKEKGAINLCKKLFSIKILRANISAKTKVKILLFRFSPKTYKYIAKKYKHKHSKYKM